MIIYSNEFYKKLSGFAALFEKRKIRKEKKIRKNYDSILPEAGFRFVILPLTVPAYQKQKALPCFHNLQYN